MEILGLSVFHYTVLGSGDKSGPSSVSRIILASYGTGARPILNHGTSTGFDASYAHNLIVSGIKFVGVVGELNDSLRGHGIVLAGYATNHLYEDCFYSWSNQIQIQGGTNWHEKIALYRSMIEDTASCYVTNAIGVLLEECVFSKPVQKYRHLYLSPAGNAENTSLRGMVARGNIFFESKYGGLHFRGGGIVDNNLIVRNDELLLGGAGGSQDSIQSGEVSNNVFTERANNGLAQFLLLQNIDGGKFNNNIWTDMEVTGSLYTSGASITIAGDVTVFIARNLTFQNNIINGGTYTGLPRCVSKESAITAPENIVVSNNNFQIPSSLREVMQILGTVSGMSFSNNMYYSGNPLTSWFSPGGTFAGWVSATGDTGSQAAQPYYPYPSRTIKTYNQTLGGAASTVEFISLALAQSRANWLEAYTAPAVNSYIRAGFSHVLVDSLGLVISCGTATVAGNVATAVSVTGSALVIVAGFGTTLANETVNVTGQALRISGGLGGLAYFGSAAYPGDGAVGAATSPSVTPPTGIPTGSLVILIGLIRTIDVIPVINVTGGQTWNALNTITTTDITARVFWCQFNGTWTANPSINLGAAICNTVVMHVFSPNLSEDIFSINQVQVELDFGDISSYVVTGQTTIGSDPTITVAGVMCSTSSTFSTSGTDWATTGLEQYRNYAGSDTSCSFAHKIQFVAGATGDVTKTLVTNGPEPGTSFIVSFATGYIPALVVNVTGLGLVISIGYESVTTDAVPTVTGLGLLVSIGDEEVTLGASADATGLALSVSLESVAVIGEAEFSVDGTGLVITSNDTTVNINMIVSITGLGLVITTDFGQSLEVGFYADSEMTLSFELKSYIF